VLAPLGRRIVVCTTSLSNHSEMRPRSGINETEGIRTLSFKVEELLQRDVLESKRKFGQK
jgi:hypothetical protein